MSAVIAREGAHSIEFAVDSHRRTLSITFWEDKQFVCMPIVHFGRDVSPTKGYIDLLSRLLSAFLAMQRLSVVAVQMPIS